MNVQKELVRRFTAANGDLTPRMASQLTTRLMEEAEDIGNYDNMADNVKAMAKLTRTMMISCGMIGVDLLKEVAKL